MVQSSMLDYVGDSRVQVFVGIARILLLLSLIVLKIDWYVCSSAVPFERKWHAEFGCI